MIFRGCNPTGNAFGAAAVNNQQWGSAQIPGTGVTEYHINIDGAGNSLADLDRIRVKAAGQTIWDVNMVHLFAFMQRLGRSNISALAADLSFTIPLDKVNFGDNNGLRFAGGFPRGLAPTVELVTLATIAAGNSYIGWTQSDQPFQFFTKYCASNPGWAAAAANNVRHPITQDGLIAGISINTVGLGRLKVKISGVEVLNLTVAQLLQTQRMQNSIVQVDPIFIEFETPIAAVGGDSYVEADTTAAWVAADEIGIYSFLPNS